MWLPEVRLVTLMYSQSWEPLFYTVNISLSLFGPQLKAIQAPLVPKSKDEALVKK